MYTHSHTHIYIIHWCSWFDEPSFIEHCLSGQGILSSFKFCATKNLKFSQYTLSSLTFFISGTTEFAKASYT